MVMVRFASSGALKRRSSAGELWSMMAMAVVYSLLRPVIGSMSSQFVAVGGRDGKVCWDGVAG